MAHPRVFISSTFYDLKQVRADLERFIQQMGYDPVLHERGSVPYGRDEKIEEYCYAEIERSDILVAIIGGRYGSKSQYQPYSISQKELKIALDLGKQVYVFVEESVSSEYSTYLENKDIEGIRYCHVDDVKIYRFLEEVMELPQNNPIAPFETSQDIINYLKEQWAGLFQRFLQEQSRLGEVRLVEGMKATAQTLDRLVAFLTEERKSQDQTIQDILLSNHPAFQQLGALTGTPYRIFFTNHDELAAWLKVRRYSHVSWHPRYDDLEMRDDGTSAYEIWKGDRDMLIIYNDIFDENGKLKVYTGEEWNKDWIIQEDLEEGEEELPF
jgi:hypothetical protein